MDCIVCFCMGSQIHSFCVVWRVFLCYLLINRHYSCQHCELPAKENILNDSPNYTTFQKIILEMLITDLSTNNTAKE